MTALKCDQCVRPADLRIKYSTEEGKKLHNNRYYFTWLCLEHAMELWNRLEASIRSGAMNWDQEIA